MKKIEEELQNTKKEYLDIVDQYIDLATKFEEAKINVIDTSKRDAIEKQMLAAMQTDETLKEWHLKLETLRRTRDKLSKHLDFLREIVKVSLKDV
jgi:hypothetical protein